MLGYDLVIFRIYSHLTIFIPASFERRITPASSNVLLLTTSPPFSKTCTSLGPPFLSKDFVFKIRAMRVPRHGLYALGAGRFEACNSSKQVDKAYKPLPIRSCECDWPTIVFESGLLEWLGRSRTNAKEWLIESRGQIRIALLISIKSALSAIRIEKWELGLARPPMALGVASNAHHPRIRRRCFPKW